ncbi:MAG: hypothetical protein RR640_06980 [Oscillospiraceae bacterium]
MLVAVKYSGFLSPLRSAIPDSINFLQMLALVAGVPIKLFLNCWHNGGFLCKKGVQD